jgi:cell division protein FtsZ
LGGDESNAIVILKSIHCSRITHHASRITKMTTLSEPVMDNPVIHNTVALRVFGVGGAGSNVLADLNRHNFDGVHFAVLNTDAACLCQSPIESRLTLGSKSTRGLGAGGDPERGRAAAVEDADRIRALCAGARVVFVVAGLGGGTGTGAAPFVAHLAKQAGALVVGIAILPFDCEGARRRRQALAGLEELRRSADAVVCLPNQKIFKLIDDNTSLLDAFAVMNEFVARAVQAIYRLLTRPGLINVDFADLCSVAQTKNSESFLVTAEARGDTRAREVVQKLVEHPLLDDSQALGEATAVLVSIAAGPGLTMAEVNRIGEQVNRQCEHAHIILGATIDEQLSDSISVTLIAACPAKPSEDHSSRGNNPGSDDSAISAAISTPPGIRPAEVPAAPRELSKETLSEQIATGRQRKNGVRMRQGQLPLDLVSKGRFEKSEPTIYQGQDLDVPTYIRRGIPLN